AAVHGSRDNAGLARPRGARAVLPRRARYVLAPVLYGKDGPRRHVRGRRQAEGLRSGWPPYRRRVHPAPGDDRQHDGALRPDRRAGGRHPAAGGVPTGQPGACRDWSSITAPSCFTGSSSEVSTVASLAPDRDDPRKRNDWGGKTMYAITGITGKVGGELARTLLAAEQPGRAVGRDVRKGEVWAGRACELALAEMEDTSALTEAFRGATAVFILPPSEFDPRPGYPEARAMIDSLVEALTAARPAKVVCLSTIGADAVHDNLLSQRAMLETALRKLPLPLTILRPAWFIDNAAWDVASARETGLIHSFLSPTDKAFPMVAAKDVGRVAADLIQEHWTGIRVVELEGPCRVTP